MDKGWTCHLLPKEIVMEVFFKTEKEDIKDLVVKKKWLKRLEERVRDEIEDIILNLVLIYQRIEERLKMTKNSLVVQNLF